MFRLSYPAIIKDLIIVDDRAVESVHKTSDSGSS
jgi:hypothetical protein